jgi:hypothetical protein
LNECGSFFEVDSGLAYVERSIPYEKGSQDLVLGFSGTDCDEFYFDYGGEASFRMELYYQERRRFELRNAEREGFEITIPGSAISYLPNDDPFFVLAVAKFENKTDPTIFQELSVIFKLRWATEIIADLDDSYGVAHGRSLYIDLNSAYVINADGNEDLYTLSYQWFCPSDYDCSGLARTGPAFAILSNELRAITDVDYLRSY